ncbi:PHD finger protein 20-like protein 1 isoform X2 [Haliotis rufescens]|uniref:PHD finger protein 20-like protein 1 isoform X2 n=1 Tax=Haliotis rufescens TaxID=6454 RepID=UPI00201F3FB7|nr:PHD finger protein 20-like protein 1 isoform X2 [Haliotis rufescens]
MASSETGMTSEQEMTDTAEEGETAMDTSETHSPFHHSEDSNSTNNETEETESAVSTDRENSLTHTPTAGLMSLHSTPVKKDGTPGTGSGFPLRPGIAWRKGERVEAMDFLNNWYPAKIMDIDEDDKTVLIHFEGWNQRYDEWTVMTSEGIRPLTRHSERKERGRKKMREFRVGEKILAKWSDCKMYPAKISNINRNGNMEVVFYDGFQKTVQPINVKPFSDKHQGKIATLPKEVRRGRRSSEGRKQSAERVRSTSQDSKDKGEKGGLAERRRKHKLIVAGSFLAKRERSASAPGLVTKPRQQKTEVKVNRRKGFGMKTSPRKGFNVKTSPVPTKSYTPRVSPLQAKRDTSAAGETPEVKTEKRGKKRALSLPAEEASLSLTHTRDHPHTPSSAPAVPAKRAKSTEKDKSGGLAPKEFVIQPDHNLFKCMIPGCAKSFRKESLLDYHFKYYHTEEPRTPQPPASRTKRRKTSSICSTDSDISVSSKGKTTPGETNSAKRKRHISSASDVLKEEPVAEVKKEEVIEEEEKVAMATPLTPATPVTPGPAEVGKSAAADTSVMEEASLQETEDEAISEEVVNCVCGYDEENGLMIQCDVCLCWQHASCFSIKYESLPSKYICFVCENPPGKAHGVRDSRRYIHDQDWCKTGHLKTFSFLDVKQSDDNSETVKATNSLIGDILNVKSALHSLKQEIHVTGSENHPEMRTWRRVCEEKRKKERVAAAATTTTASYTTEATATTTVTQSVTMDPLTTNAPAVSESESDSTKQEVSKETTDESQDTSTVVTFSLDTDTAGKEKPNIPEQESPLSKSMGCQASLDLSGSSLDRSDEKSVDISMADNDSDTSTMTASESSVSYMSCLPSGTSASLADDSQIVPSSDNLDKSDIASEVKMEHFKVKVELPESEKEDALDEEVEFVECERALLLHIVRVQAGLNDRLDLIEDQIEALEKADSSQRAPQPSSQPNQAQTTPTQPKSILGDVPILKKSLHSLIRDLGKVKSMAAYH